MNCLQCKNSVIKDTTVKAIEKGKCIIVVKDVPCLKCVQCGYESFSDEVKEQLENICDSYDESFVEFVVVKYC